MRRHFCSSFTNIDSICQEGMSRIHRHVQPMPIALVMIEQDRTRKTGKPRTQYIFARKVKTNRKQLYDGTASIYLWDQPTGEGRVGSTSYKVCPSN